MTDKRYFHYLKKLFMEKRSDVGRNAVSDLGSLNELVKETYNYK